ncbi:MAG: amidase [Byssovorax sp.]
MITELCSKSATELSRLLAAGEISSEEATKAHLERIDAVDRGVRAFTTVFRYEALAAARKSDEERQRGEVRGPLHGLPVTVKESLDMAGFASTLGAPSRRNVRATEDAGITQMLREAGAVILGRTNVSQLMLYNEARNPIFGQTVNPWSLDHSPGGSSGGESAAIAAGMSPLGIGTDIGGSIRVPAGSTGIAGLKPTLDRWTNKGSNTALLGQEVIRSQLGPMARSAHDLALAMRALDPARMTALDPRVAPVPFADPALHAPSSLRVGVYTDDGLVPSSASVVRAVNEAAAALRSQGATVIDFTPPGMTEAAYDYFGAMSADGGAAAARVLAGGAVDPSLQPLLLLARVPPPVRRAAARLAELAGEHRLSRFLAAVGEKSVTEIWAITARLRGLRALILDAMAEAGIDLLLCPVYATPAIPHGVSKDFTMGGTPSMLWNAVQFPAGVVPVTRVTRAETVRESPRDRLEKRAAEVDAKSEGLPVGVQVVGRPWEEDRVLAAMIAIEDVVSKAPGFPQTPVRPRTG